MRENAERAISNHPSHQVVRNFQKSLVVFNLLHGSEWNVYRVAFLEFVDLLIQKSGDEGKNREEWIEDVCDVLIAQYAYTTLFSLLSARKHIVQEGKLHANEEDVLDSAYVVALALKLDFASDILPEERRSGVVISKCCGSSLDAVVYSGDTKMVKRVLDNLGEDRSVDSIKISALTMAISQNRVEMVDLITPTLSDHVFYLPKYSALLILAAHHNRFDIVRTLGHIIPANHKLRYGSTEVTIMCIACRLGNYNYVKEIVESPKPIRHSWSDAEQGSPMILAARYNQVEIVDLLRDHHVRIYYNESAILEIVAQAGHLPIVKLLISKPKASPGITKESIYWSFVRAIEHNHLDIAQYLWPKVDKNVYLYAWPENYHTTGLKGAMRNESYDTLRWLVRNCGVSVERYPRKYVLKPPTPAVDAMIWEMKGLLEVLFALGADGLDLEDESVKRHIPEVLSVTQQEMLELSERWRIARRAGCSYERFVEETE